MSDTDPKPKRPPLTDEERFNYEGPDLAATLLVRTGMMEPEDIERRTRKTQRRRRLKTPKDVIRAIGDVVAEIEDGTAQPQVARARLYALQTLLVAMRMQAETERQSDPPFPRQPLQLQGVAEPLPETPAATELQHLQQLTAADHESPKETQP